MDAPKKPAGVIFSVSRASDGNLLVWHELDMAADDQVELAARLMDEAIAIAAGVDSQSAEALWEAEKSRRWNNLAAWAQERGCQGALADEIAKWHKTKSGELQRVLTAADRWKDADRNRNLRLKQLVAEYFTGTPAPEPRELG